MLNEEYSLAVKNIADTCNLITKALQNIAKVMSKLAKEYIKKYKTNNWLKMHGISMRRKYRKYR